DGAVTSAADVNAASSVRADLHAGLDVDQVDGIASAGSDNRELLDRVLREEVSEVAGRVSLDGFRISGDFDRLGDSSHSEDRVDGGWLTQVDLVAFRDKFLEALGLYFDGVGPDLNRIKDVGTG